VRGLGKNLMDISDPVGCTIFFMDPSLLDRYIEQKF